MRTNPNDAQDKSTYLDPGELIVWRWLGIDRFFPPNQKGANVLHGCSSVCAFFSMSKNKMLNRSSL